MKTFLVKWTRIEAHNVEGRVTAKDEAEAVSLAQRGEGDFEELGYDYSHCVDETDFEAEEEKWEK